MTNAINRKNRKIAKRLFKEAFRPIKGATEIPACFRTGVEAAVFIESIKEQIKTLRESEVEK